MKTAKPRPGQAYGSRPDRCPDKEEKLVRSSAETSCGSSSTLISRVMLAACFLAMIPAGCDQQIQEGQQRTTEQKGTQGGQSAATQQTTKRDTAVVRGFSVEGPAGLETTVPQVSVERKVRIENGRLEVDLGMGPLRETREDVRRGLESLRATGADVRSAEAPTPPFDEVFIRLGRQLAPQCVAA
jgi:hypothetical protein